MHTDAKKGVVKMNKFLGLFLITIMLFAPIPGAFAATPAPGGPFATAFRIQNLEDLTASCMYELYNEAGSLVVTSAVTTVAPGDSLYVYTPTDLPLLASGSYSAVVNCDKKAAAVVNFSDPDSGASHNGVTEPGPVWYAPGIYDNFYNYYSNIFIQNAGSTPVDIKLEIFSPASSVPVVTQTKTAVPAYTTVVFEQEGLTALLYNQFYSAKITATGNVAPVVNIYGKDAVNGQLYSYNPFKSGSTVAYAPIIMNNYYSFNTALVIQNIDTTTANVTVSYTNGLVKDYSIPAGAPLSLYTPQSGLPSGNTLYGATVTSDKLIVVMVNQSNNMNRAASYSGLTAGALEVSAPVVMKNYYGFETSVVCQNLGNAATNITITYAGVAGSTTRSNVLPGGVAQFYTLQDPLLIPYTVNWIGSATVTSTASNIGCIVNEGTVSSLNTTYYDQLYSYNGIPVIP